MTQRSGAVDGRPVGVSTSEDLIGADGTTRAQPVSTVDDVDRLVEDLDPGVVILSRRVVLADRLKIIEPGLRPRLVGVPIVWSVIGIDPSAGQLTVRIDGAERVIADRAAAGLYVLPGQLA